MPKQVEAKSRQAYSKKSGAPRLNFNQTVVPFINPETGLTFRSCSVAGVGGIGAPLAAIPAVGRLHEGIVAEGLARCMKRGISIYLCESKNSRA